MKLAKKTLSVALAAMMAVSSAAVATSAFAAEPTYTAVKLGQKVTVESKLAIDTTKDLAKQIEADSDLNYYSFTPAKTGYYQLKAETEALYEGYKYIAAKDDCEKDEAGQYMKSYATSNKNLIADPNASIRLESESRVDYIVIADKADKNEDKTPSLAITLDETTGNKGWGVEELTYTASYKYENGNIVATNSKGENKDTYTDNGMMTTSEQFLLGGQTYYFTAKTFTHFVEKSKKAADGKTDVKYYEQDASQKACFTITAIDWVAKNYLDTNVEQKVEVPTFYKAKTGETVKEEAGVKYVVKKIGVPSTAVTYTGTASDVKVPDEINGYKVTTVSAIKDGSMTSLTLGKNVTKIADDAVIGAFRLTTLKLNEGLKEIGKQAFAGATALKEVTIPSTVETIGKDAFKNTGIKKATITNAKQSIAGTGLGYDKDGAVIPDFILICPAESKAYYDAVIAGIKVGCTKHDMRVTKAATVFATGVKECANCGDKEVIAKLTFAPKFNAKKGAVEVKGNAGKVAKVAVWVDGKKTVKKNVTKCTVKGLKAGKHVVKVKLYDANGNKTATVKKTVKVK